VTAQFDVLGVNALTVEEIHKIVELLIELLSGSKTCSELGNRGGNEYKLLSVALIARF
jgi:hypothetical protein